MQLALLDRENIEFPPASHALTEPDGLLAIGGNLNPDTLLKAYQQGIFPWFSEGDPILWWSPNPRTVIFPEQLHISKSLNKFIRKHPYQITFDHAFSDVMDACSEPRSDDDGTWIVPAMKKAYLELHQRGIAHSVEVWDEGELVGGLYGVAIGGTFCGESMFSKKTNTSKLALAELVRKQPGLRLIDCQVYNAHLESLGATQIPRQEFLERLKQNSFLVLNWQEA